MKRFHTQFSLLLSKHLRSKADVAREVGTDTSVISRLALGTADCSAEVMGKIARCFPQEDQLRLLAAWVEDKAETAGYSPAQLRASLGSSDGLHAPAGLRDDLEIILASGGNSRELRGIISNLADLLRPAKEDAHPAEEHGPAPQLPPPRPVSYGKKPRK